MLVEVREERQDGALLYSTTIPTISAGGSATLYPSLASDSHILFAKIDPLNVIAQRDESNNMAIRTLFTQFWTYIAIIMR